MTRDCFDTALLPVPSRSYLHRLLAPRLVGEVFGIRFYADPLMPSNTWELRPAETLYGATSAEDGDGVD